MTQRWVRQARSPLRLPAQPLRCATGRLAPAAGARSPKQPAGWPSLTAWLPPAFQRGSRPPMRQQLWHRNAPPPQPPQHAPVRHGAAQSGERRLPPAMPHCGPQPACDPSSSLHGAARAGRSREESCGSARAGHDAWMAGMRSGLHQRSMLSALRLHLRCRRPSDDVETLTCSPGRMKRSRAADASPSCDLHSANGDRRERCMRQESKLRLDGCALPHVHAWLRGAGNWLTSSCHSQHDQPARSTGQLLLSHPAHVVTTKCSGSSSRPTLHIRQIAPANRKVAARRLGICMA